MGSHDRMATVAVVALVLLAGCGGGGGDGLAGGPLVGEKEAGAPATAGGDAGGARDGGAGGGGTPAAQSAGVASSSVVGNRALVRTGTVTLEVEDFDAARADVASLARKQGGFVAGSSETQHARGNRTWTTGEIVVRVPSESFAATFESTKEEGEVVSSESGVRDVTDRLVDLRARLSNLRSQRERLRALYERANDTEDVLRVGKRLSNVQERIERLEAERRTLEERVAYSTVTVVLREPRPGTPTPSTEPAYHETPLYAAFVASVGGVEVALRAAAVTLAYLLPYLLAFGLPAIALAAVVHRQRGIP